MRTEPCAPSRTLHGSALFLKLLRLELSFRTHDSFNTHLGKLLSESAGEWHMLALDVQWVWTKY